MKSGITELSGTRRRLDVEIPAAEVDAVLDKLTRRRRGRARLPGFRPGKAPLSIVRQRFKEEILHDAANDLVPPAVETALREHGASVVDTPDVRDVSIEEGRPLTFHALFEVMPAHHRARLRRPDPAAAPGGPRGGGEERAIEQLRLRASRVVPVTDRAIETGDIAILDLKRRADGGGDGAGRVDEPEQRATVELGAEGNPPGFDDELVGLSVGDSKTFELTYPEGSAPAELAGRRVTHEVTVREHHRRVLPDVDEAFAKSAGGFDSVEALKDRIAADLRREADVETRRGVRRDLLRQLSSRLTAEVPEALVEHEIARRVEQVAGAMARQGIDPRTANVDWNALREEAAGAGPRGGPRLARARRGGAARGRERQRRGRRAGGRAARRTPGPDPRRGAGPARPRRRHRQAGGEPAAREGD